jgi:RNA polymerase sigma-70 factor (ECF subfamily)
MGARRYARHVTDEELLERLLAGDEQAFRDLVSKYHTTLVRVARYHVGSEAAAEDVAQDTWVAVLKGVHKFEGRSSFKTWLFRILVNRARTSGTREHRMVSVDPNEGSATVPASRFDSSGAWTDPPAPFTDEVEARLDDAVIVRAIHQAIRELPEPQQAVVTLRDVEGLSTYEVAALLGLTEANVRVILHRGRAKVRAALEDTVKAGAP